MMNIRNARKKRQRLTAFLMFFTLCFLLLGPVFRSQAARPTGTVKNPILNVRSSASTLSLIHIFLFIK